MKDLRAKNIDLAQRQDENLHYEDVVWDVEAKAIEAEKRRVEVEGQLRKPNDDIERLRKELHETECQVAASRDHCFATVALEALNKEKSELR